MHASDAADRTALATALRSAAASLAADGIHGRIKVIARPRNVDTGRVVALVSVTLPGEDWSTRRAREVSSVVFRACERAGVSVNVRA